MSGGLSCKCDAPILVVTMRKANYSAFNGYHYTPSDYSQIKCRRCGATWRSKAKFVQRLPDASSVGAR